MKSADLDAVAAEAVSLLGSGRQVTPYSERYAGFDLASAYDVGERIRLLREARGRRVAGRKIGFTNRHIWETYSVSGPIWSYMYRDTVRDEVPSPATIDVAALPEPLIEPEIAFHFARAPTAGMSDGELMACIDWIAHGIEIVVSIFPGWTFAAADTIAGYGMHHMLMLGARANVAEGSAASWVEHVTGFEVELREEAGVLRKGHARDVLGSPLAAIRFLLAEIDRFGSPPLQAGEVVTTGTLTEAMPLRAGQTWTTRLNGIPLPGLELHIL